MNMTSKLSVSSVILAAVLSQQAFAADSYSSQQQIEGSQQQVEENAYVEEAAIPVAKPRPAKRNGLGLPAAKPGQCFAKVKVPATYKNQQRRLLIQKASTTRKLVRAPQYRWINKKVLVRKPVYKTNTIPAQYKTVNKRVMVKPAYNTWRKGHGAITRIDNMTGQIMCRVTVPAVYRYVQQNVLVKPARTVRTLVPAVYKTVKQKQLVAPAQYRTVHIPARYKTQNYRVKTGSARYIWRSVLCQTNAPKNNYRQAPKNYRQAVVKHKPVVRTNKKTYRKSGISYQDYLKVMRAGSVKTKAKIAKPVKKQTKSITQQEYLAVMRTKTANKAKPVVKPVAKKVRRVPAKKKASNFISQQEYRAVMNAKTANKTKPVVKKVRRASPKKTSSYISQQEYLSVMRAKIPSKAKPAVKKTQRASTKKYSGVISQKEYFSVMKSKPVNMTKPAVKKAKPAVKQTKISTTDYQAVMRAKVPAKVKQVAKPVATKAPVKERYKLVTKKKQQSVQKSDKKVGIVYGIQKALLAKGFDPGSMDGKMGAGTAAALKAFQSSRGLPIGQLNKDTFRALGLIR